jgi:hypothetical protein
MKAFKISLTLGDQCKADMREVSLPSLQVRCFPGFESFNLAKNFGAE